MDDERVSYIAKLQDGLITRRQALAAGMSADAWKHRTRKGGPWQRVVRGVYATFTGPLAEVHRFRAAVLHAGPSARITCAWACWMHGLRYGPEPVPDRVAVLVPRSCQAGSVGFVAVTKTERPYEMNHSWSGGGDPSEDPGSLAAMSYGPAHPIAGDARPGVIPVVSPARAVIDTVTKHRLLPPQWRTSGVGVHGGPPPSREHVLRTHALRNVRALMCEVVQRGSCTVAALATELAGAPRAGTGLAGRVLVDLEVGCRSAPECELRDVVKISTVLPEPRWNQVLPGARRLYPDACWPDATLVVEVDSWAFHGFGDAPERTERRRARYAALGWTVLPVAPRRIRDEPAQVLAEIEAAYLAGLSRAR